MASRHDIINITFQANAGKANVALQALQTEAKKSSDRVEELRKKLQEGINANLPANQIQKIRDDIRAAEKETKQWNKAYQELTKGVRTLDEAVKQFNAGTMGKMSAAFNKAAANAAKLAQTKMTSGTQEWKEMDALIVEAQSNVLKANTAINELTASIKKGGSASKSTLTQAKTDLEQLLTLEVRGSAEWNTYDKQLKVVNAELNKMAEAERKAAQADQTAMMNKRMKDLKTMSSSVLAETKRYWKTMVDGAEKGSAELAKYEAKLKQVTNEEKRRITENAKNVLADPQKFGVEQVRQVVQQMTLLRDSLQAQTPMWKHYNKLVQQGSVYLQQYADTEKIVRGEAMSLADALKLSANAGGRGFSGTTTQLQQAQQVLERAIATTDKGSAKYDRLQKALARVRAEMTGAGMSSERMHRILQNPKSEKSVDTLRNAVAKARGELEVMGQRTERMRRLLQQATESGNTKWASRLQKSIADTTKAYDQLSSSTKKAEQAQKDLANQSKGTASAFDKAWSRLKTYIGLYMGAAVVIQKLVATMGDLMELSDKMGEVRKTTGFTAEEVGRLSDNLAKLDTRTSLTGLMELSAAAGQLGLKTEEDVRGFTEAANMLMVALPEMGKEGATAMLKVALATGEIDKIRQQMQEGLIEGSSATAVAMTKIGSTIDQLRANSAAAAPAITDFVKRVGAVGAQSGITIDQVAALGSTVDALGMRVEMSATALSRMIPAIKNNAFELAHAIGVAPNTIRDLFEAGRGMEAILMIFQHIKDAGMDEDSIEQMMNMGGMKDIMKDLNQQGARAGIVFAGLSQNVDELRRQLGVAKTAYEENIAITNEYNKMNDTTAAKWERLKNQLEEMVVGDQAQRFLGDIIDKLRWIVDFISGNLNPALNTLSAIIKMLVAGWAAFKLGLGEGLFVKSIAGIKSLGESIALTAMYTKDYIVLQWKSVFASDAQAKAAAKAKLATLGLSKAMKANVIMAVVAAVGYLVFKLRDLAKESKEAAADVGRFNQQVAEEQKALNNLFEPLNKSNLAQEERSKLISEINSKYSQYLGYMLSETTTALQLADAHALIAKRIKEEAYERRIAEQEKKIQEQHDEALNAAYGEITRGVRGSIRGGADVQDVADLLKRVVDNRIGQIEYATYNAPQYGQYPGQLGTTTNSPYNLDPKIKAAIDGGIDKLVAEGKIYGNNVNMIRNAVYAYTVEAKSQHDDIMRQTSNVRSDLRGIQGAIKTDLTNNLNTLIGNIANFSENANKSQTTQPLILAPQESKGGVPNMFTTKKKKSGIWNIPWTTERETTPMQEYAPMGWKPSVDKKNLEQVRQFVAQQDELRGALQAGGEQIDDEMRRRAESWLVSEKELEDYRKIVEAANKRAGGGGGGGGLANPWGSTPSADSTDYALFDVNELVARRNQMDKFKNILKPDTDIKKVLAEDAALMKAINNGEIEANMQDVLNWYNRERLKIQQELKSERFSTNEGHWRDEATKKGRKRANPLLESDYALAELDRYYSRRKEMLEEARIKENMTEEMFNRQAELLEQEHLQKRSDLRNTFTNHETAEEKERIKTFRAWWKKLEESGDLDEVPWATVESEWAKATAAQIGQNNLKAQKDLTQMQQITVKHLNEIAKIIAKERPYDGITENLQNNLTKMDILLKDMLDPSKYSPAEMVSENNKRLSFLLKEAEHAYSLTADQLMADMGEEGFQAWADALANDENSEELTQNLLAELRKVYDSVQDAIKKEANQMKRQVEIMWNDTILPNGQSQKQFFESTLSALGLQEDQVKRANSMIGAGQASERVASKLAIQQMKVRLAMQTQYYNMLEKIGNERIAQLEAAGKLEDAEHVRKSLNLALSEEQKKKDEQRVGIQNQLEESQARLYQELKSWSELFASSLQSVFEASNTGLGDYYNSLAKMRLTGEGAGGGTYVIIDNAGTSKATAHYEYLDGEAALRRQLEIEQQNAVADAWKKVMDDINMKINDLITDQINAMLQNASIDLNTEATNLNTAAIEGLTEVIKGNADKGNIPSVPNISIPATEFAGTGTKGEKKGEPVIEIGPLGMEWEKDGGFSDSGVYGTEAGNTSPYLPGYEGGFVNPWTPLAEESNAATEVILQNQKDIQEGQKAADRQVTKSSKASFAAMTAAANMYGVAYQAMANDNLSTTQKVEMMIVQAAGQAAISMLTASLAASQGETAANAPSWISKTLKELGPIGGPVAVGVFTALIGGLMGLAMSKITKSKSEIAQVTGASMGAGRLSTGMLTYAEGNVNEFTDPNSLTPGRHYNVDGADGKTYRAKYMGKNAKTHITNGPEFHLVGEAGREAIIDAHTTRLMQMNDTGIWQAIQTLYNGGSLRATRRRSVGRGIRAFADGNLDEFEAVDSGQLTGDSYAGYSMEQMAAMQSSLDRQNDLLEQLLTKGVKGYFDVYGKNGLVDSYDRGKKTVMRHGEKY